MKKIKIEKPKLKANDLVTVTSMGDILEVKYLSHRNCSPTVKKLDKDHYLIVSTGEVIVVDHNDHRSECVHSLATTFKNLRELINCNYSHSHPENLLWLTLTFAENEKDPNVFAHCFDIFWKRMKRYFEKNDISVPKYITCVEPQSRGAWHGHMLLFFDKPAPFISNNDVLEKKWEWGFTKISRLDNISNVGAYLTAYLTDLPLNELDSINVNTSICTDVKEIQGVDCDKKFIKGGRLHLYPTGMKLYRASTGLNHPVKSVKTYEKASEMVKCLNGKLCYERHVLLEDSESDFSSIVSVQQYFV